MRRAADALLDEIDELAELLASEQGKPRAEAYAMELLPTIDALHWCAEAGPEILADERIRFSQPFLLSKRSHFAFEPLGVVGVIAPWNYPWSIPFGEVAIALMAGNGVVLKPASLTPLLGDRIRGVFERAGFPDGLVQTVHGGGRIGDALVRSSAGKIFFTGSVEVGRKVGESCARQLKGSVLELGGKDPMIVCADADLDNAVSGALWGGFANAGQTCSGIERVYVVREVAERFVAAVAREAGGLKVGDPLDWDTQIGPMTSADQHGSVCELVDDALASGAERLCGGPVTVPGLSGEVHLARPSWRTSPTRCGSCARRSSARCCRSSWSRTRPEAIDLANDSEFGLGASVWTRDRQKGERISRRIASGMVWINDHSFTHGACQCSWGGVKSSGLGRSHSKFGFYECSEVKLVTWEPGMTRDLWWFPYDRALADALRSSARLLYGRNGRRAEALREGIGPLLRVGARALRKGR